MYSNENCVYGYLVHTVILEYFDIKHWAAITTISELWEALHGPNGRHFCPYNFESF